MAHFALLKKMLLSILLICIGGSDALAQSVPPEFNPFVLLRKPASSISDDPNPTIGVVRVPAGLEIALYGNADCSGEVLATEMSALPITLLKPNLVDVGLYQFHVKVKNIAGEFSQCSQQGVDYEYTPLIDNAPIAITANDFSWVFENGITNFEASNNSSPVLRADLNLAEDIPDIELVLYLDPNCSKDPISNVLLGGFSTLIDNLTFANDGSEDGTKSFFAVIKVGEEALECVDTGLSYDYDSQIETPSMNRRSLCGKTIGPQQTMAVTCEPEATVNLNVSNSTTLEIQNYESICGPKGTTNFQLNVREDSEISIELDQIDLASNVSSIFNCSTDVKRQSEVSSKDSQVNLSFDDVSEITISGECSHTLGELVIADDLTGHMEVIACEEEGEWQATVNYSGVGSSGTAQSLLTITHKPGGGALESRLEIPVNTCSSVAKFLAFSDLRDFEFRGSKSVSQTPIFDFGDGTPKVAANQKVSHDYQLDDFPYTVSVQHCPKEITNISYTRSPNTFNDIQANFQTFLSGGVSSYANLQYLVLNNNDNNKNGFGFFGQAPSLDELPELVNYSLLYHGNISSLPKQVTCRDNKLQTFQWFSPTQNQPTLVHPIFGENCYDSLTYYRVIQGGRSMTGPIPDIAKFTSPIRRFEANGFAGSVVLPKELKNKNLRGYYVYGIGENGGDISFESSQVTDISKAILLQDFVIHSNRLEGSLSDSYFDRTGFFRLQRFEIHNNKISGVLNEDFLPNKLRRLSTFYVQNNKLTGIMPLVSHLSTLRGYGVSSNQLDIKAFPDPSGLSQLQFFLINDNPVTTGPFKLPDFSSLRWLRRFVVNGIPFSGSEFSVSDLLPTRIEDFRMQFGTNVTIKSLEVPKELERLRFLLLDGNPLDVSSQLSLGSSPPENLREVGLKQMGASKDMISELVNNLWFDRALWQSSLNNRKVVVDVRENGGLSEPALQQVHGEGAFLNEGLMSDYNIDVQYE